MYTKVIKDEVLVGINREDGANIPIESSNADYQEYLQYVEDNPTEEIPELEI